MSSWTMRAALAGALATGGATLALAAPGANEQAEIAALTAAPVAPTSAIRAAEAHAGGKALGFGYEKDASTNAYEVTVATSSGLQRVQVDPAQGTVLATHPAQSDAMAEDGLPATALQQAKAAPASLADAVSAAEQAAGGRALEANYALHDGQMRVDVDVAKNGAVESVTVDPANGHAQIAAAENEAQEEQGEHGSGHHHGGEGGQDAD